jgi:hypothetical protein
MDCEETQAALVSFLGGKLSGEESRRIRLHLAGCAECASRLSELDKIELLTVIDEEIEPSSYMATRFRSRLEEHRSRAAEHYAGLGWFRRHWRWGRQSQLAAAMGVVVLLAAGVFWNKFTTGSFQRGSTISEINIAENLSLLRDMAVIENLDLLEDFDNIQDLSATTIPEQ